MWSLWVETALYRHSALRPGTEFCAEFSIVHCCKPREQLVNYVNGPVDHLCVTKQGVLLNGCICTNQALISIQVYEGRLLTSETSVKNAIYCKESYKYLIFISTYSSFPTPFPLLLFFFHGLKMCSRRFTFHLRKRLKLG